MLHSKSLSPESMPLPPPPGFEEIQRKALARLFGKMAGIRIMALPLALAIFIPLALSEITPWRIALLSGLLIGAITFFVTELVRFRRRGLLTYAFPLNLTAIVLVQLLLSFATGGLESPFIYAFPIVAIMAGVFTHRRVRLALVVLQISGVWFLTDLELTRAISNLNLKIFGGGPRAGHNDAHLITTAIFLSIALPLSARAGSAVRNLFDTMLAQALRARDDSLHEYAAQAQELTALSAGIAHELKNPLASVKGLAALLAESLPTGKGLERLTVLRREVDRMHGVLDEFLNFSRPLVPLALETVDLTALVREIAALHEGLAQGRSMCIDVAGEVCRARVDARKVKQIIINLVQNALEASPSGARVELVVAPAGGDRARVIALDRGPGLDAALALRAFDPGVTSKAHGSGLGLTVARALARQHGGEVTLAERAGGGCIATLTLPRGLEGEATSEAIQ